MMHGHEKSDPAIVAMKPANKAERSAAELVERRAETKGNADQQSTRRTQSRKKHVTGAGPPYGQSFPSKCVS
jgi:RNA-directed DNA polymerase